MKILEKIVAKNNDVYNQKPVTIAFLGDSVTQGCFEVYFKLDGCIETVFDSENAFSTKLKKILNYVCPSAQINVINSGISGDNAINGNNRFERDIAPFNPDLVIVGFALNDCMSGKENIKNYQQSLESIFNKVKNIGAECIMLTPNVMNDCVSPHFQDERLKNIAKSFMENNCLDEYVQAGCEIAKKCNVKICDVYSIWKKMREAKINTTELLANKLNHPTREMNFMTAMKLAETILMDN